MENVMLEMRGITKYIFDSAGKALHNTNVKILEGVDFNLREGEVHILVGENGAGKSTLMKVLGGIIPPDEGEIILNGKKMEFQNPMDARNHGIAFVHQELNLCANMDIASNIFLGAEPTTAGFTNKKEMYRKASELLMSLGFDFDPRANVGSLSTAQQQIVEVVTALSYKSKIIIMDEPTASLTQKEIDHLFRIILDLKAKGVSIIYISHRFDEFTQIGDRVSVLRDGRMIKTFPMSEFDTAEVIRLMVGRETNAEMFENTHQPSDEVILELDQVKILPNSKPCSIKVRKGEVVGLGGLVGSGRTELAKVIFGARKYYGGKIIYEGQEYIKPTPVKAIKNGIAYLSEDRKAEGLILDFSIKHNITLASLSRLFKSTFLNRRVENEVAQKQIQDTNVICRCADQIVNTLSGGNQQRVVLSKWLETNPRLLILDEPTRGIDVKAKAEIYHMIDQIVSQGVAVLMISSEMPELIGMSDRIYVMREGTISLEIASKAEMTQERILESTLGQSEATANTPA